ncbi:MULTISPECIES: magnesium and cobalt transport protein CorA [Pseudomonas]|uniref:magnesium and cobalt transport protein CorA n=1 Tax=Pseudomonas TaxID=286 RepID=UPI001E286278|nr:MULTISPECIES: magnesium and cobalt transport protein CorA [Pseudomonas]MCE4073058.1 magnesium and cobalt transport protein CorA [Pseudomonas nitritireducens]MCE4082363.1 magnesium and cobalt transport protein CorA [Pseudomonas nitroreducens]
MGRVIASAVYSKGRKVSDIALEDGYRWACQPDHFVWTGLQEPTPEEMFNLQRQFNLHELAVSDALEKHSRPKLETFGDALFIVIYSPIRADSRLMFVETHLFAGIGYIISARHGFSQSYSQVRQRCEARPLLLAHGTDFVLYALLDFVMSNYEPVVEAIREEIEEVEQQVLRKSLTQEQIEKIYGLRREVLKLKHYAAPMVEICQELQRLDFPFIDKQMRPYFRDVAIHVNRLLEDLTTLRDVASQTIEVGLALESSRQSVVQRKFAAWAAILAFPTAVAGIYGMNFEYIPELHWHYGYFLIMGLLALGCVGLYISFKQADWL